MDQEAAKQVHDKVTLKKFLEYHRLLYRRGIVSRDIEHVAVDADFRIVAVTFKARSDK